MFKNFFAGLLLSLFVLLALPLTFVFGVYHTFLNEDFYKGDFIDFVHDFLLNDADEVFELEKFIDLTDDEFSQVIGKTFTKADLLKFIDDSADIFIEKMSNLEGQAVVAKIPLKIIKDKEELLIENLANVLYLKLPKCTGVNESEAADFKCIPNGLQKPDFESMLGAELDRKVFAEIPNEFTLNMNVPVAFGDDVPGLVIDVFVWTLVIGSLILLMLLLGILWVVRKPWYEFSRYVAKAFMLTSSIMLIFLIFLYFIPDTFGNNPENANSPVLMKLLTISFKAFAENLSFFMIPILIISLILWVVSIRFRKNHES